MSQDLKRMMPMAVNVNYYRIYEELCIYVQSSDRHCQSSYTSVWIIIKDWQTDVPRKGTISREHSRSGNGQ